MSAWLYGRHAVQAVLKHRPETVASLHVLAHHQDSLDTLPCPIHAGTREQLSRLASTDDHQGWVAQVRRLTPETPEWTPWIAQKKGPLLVLEGLEDPRNLGACLRNADALGAQAVVVPRNRGSMLNPTACKVACGAAEVVPCFEVANLARSMDQLKEAGYWLVGLSASSPPLASLKPCPPVGLVLGAEGTGLRQLTQKKCDHVASIPMRARCVDSLNVSVACGIALHHVAAWHSLSA